MGNFTVELLAEAVEFMDSLDVKTRDKIYYNIRKAQSTYDTEIFKNLIIIFGSLEHYIMEKHIGFFLFGIQLIVQIP